MKTAGTPKLWPRWIGPFTVQDRIGDRAYRLDLPPSLKLHNVFHVGVLKPYLDSGRVQPPPAPLEVLEDGGEIYEVEAVLAHRSIKGRHDKEFLIQWTGYGPEHNSWEPERYLDAPALRAYWDSRQTRQPPKGKRGK